MRGDARKVLLNKPMSRKEFLQAVGGTMVSLLGVPNFLEAMRKQKPAPPVVKPTDDRYAFGTRKFGV